MGAQHRFAKAPYKQWLSAPMELDAPLISFGRSLQGRPRSLFGRLAVSVIVFVGERKNVSCMNTIKRFPLLFIWLFPPSFQP